MISLDNFINNDIDILQYVNENKTGEIEEIVDKSYSPYNGVKMGYIQSYGKSYQCGEIMNALQMTESIPGATLYGDGRLIFFMTFNNFPMMVRFFMLFYKYEDKYTGESDPKDGKWHLYFDAHGDPGTGITNNNITFHLCYNAKTQKLSEIDKAIDEIYKRLVDEAKRHADWDSKVSEFLNTNNIK